MRVCGVAALCVALVCLVSAANIDHHDIDETTVSVGVSHSCALKVFTVVAVVWQTTVVSVVCVCVFVFTMLMCVCVCVCVCFRLWTAWSLAENRFAGEISQC